MPSLASKVIGYCQLTVLRGENAEQQSYDLKGVSESKVTNYRSQ
jgi:hypothetical protein